MFNPNLLIKASKPFTFDNDKCLRLAEYKAQINVPCV